MNASWVMVGLAAAKDSLPLAASIVLVIATSPISLKLILSRIGDQENEMSELAVVTGLMSALFLWYIIMEFTAVPGILFVTGGFIFFLWRLRNRILGQPVVPPYTDLKSL